MAVPTDSIGDFLTRIRNASHAGKAKVTVPCSKLSLRISEILKREGYVENVKAVEEQGRKYIRIHLKYMTGKKPVIQAIVRSSKPGIRYYVGSKEIPRVLGGLGMAIISTSKGLKTDREARQEGVGGELLCKVW